MADGGNLSGRVSQGSRRTGGDATAGEGVEADGHGGSLLVDKYTVHALEEQLRSGPTRSREMTCSALWGLSTFAPNRRLLADLFPRLVTYIADASLLQVREKAAGALANLAEDEEVLVAPPAAIWRQSGARRALSVARGQVCARYARDVNLTGLRRMLVVLRYGLPHLDGDDEDGSAGEHGTRLHFGPEQASRLSGNTAAPIGRGGGEQMAAGAHCEIRRRNPRRCGTLSASACFISSVEACRAALVRQCLRKAMASHTHIAPAMQTRKRTCRR
jgi:hypothetical protein